MVLSIFFAISASLISVLTQDIISDNKGITLSSGIEIVGKKILTANSIKEFGGFSGMIFDEDDKLIVPSDKNGVVLTKYPIFKNDIITGFRDSRMIKLQGKKDKFLNNKLFQEDQEDIAYYDRDCFISLERVNKIILYKGCNFYEQGLSIKIPKALKDFPINKGMEAFGIDNSGNFLTISEYYEDNKKLHKSYIWQYKNHSYDYIKNNTVFFYKSDKYFRVSALTFSNDGDLFVLERKYKKPFVVPEMTTKVKWVSRNAINNIKVGSVIVGQELVRIEGYPVVKSEDKDYILADNFEAIAVKQNSKNTISIFLMSDDNFNINQKTIFLQFKFDKNQSAFR